MTHLRPTYGDAVLLKKQSVGIASFADVDVQVFVSVLLVFIALPFRRLDAAPHAAQLLAGGGCRPSLR